MATDDQVLLRRHCVNGDQEAFGELVRRHLGLVYGAALRQLSDPGLAEDVTQIVFIRLAQRAKRLPRNVMLAGWLYADTRLTALQFLRGDRRRRTREAEALEMQLINSSVEQDWTRLRPVLDEAMEGLSPGDRDVLLLRFFEGRSLREVGATFGLSEDAARMRVSRALDKLRQSLSSLGISTAAEVLSASLTAYGAPVAPSALAAFVTTSALAAGTPAGGATIALVTMTNAKLATFGVIAVVGAIAPAIWQHRQNATLHEENLALRSELVAVRGSYEDAQKQIDKLGAESNRLAPQDQEIARLRNALRDARQQLSKTSGPQQPVLNDKPAPQTQPLSEVEIAAFLQRSRVEQAEELGHLRRQMMGQEKRSDAEFSRNRALAEAIRPMLEELESQPEQFADFQASFVKTVLDLQDNARVAQIRQIIEQTYQQAVSDKLDAKSRPVDGVDAWGLRRDALDRQATHAVEQLLSNEERDRFGHAFIGIMGIDLGINDGVWHRFVMPNGGVVFPSEAQAR